MSNPIVNFYKSTITQDWSIGTGNFYVSVKPTTSVGRLVVSPSSDSLREIIEYTSTGTDGNGDYIVISTRGVGGTTEQPHTVGEKVRMNITAEDWEDIRDDIDSIVAAGAPDASTTTKGLVEIATDAQGIAGDDVGETGASLVMTPSKINTQITSRLTSTCGISSKNLDDASITQEIAHGLGRTPYVVRLVVKYFASSENFTSYGVFSSSGNRCIWTYTNNIDETSTSYSIAIASVNSNPQTSGQTGMVTVDGTNISIAWTKNGSPTGTYSFMWEAQ